MVMSTSITAPFQVTPTGFLLHGKPFQVRSGELHFARIPREYWRHRLEMARAMGLNTVCAYLFWNIHEPAPGEFVFSDIGDVKAFVLLAQEVGLKVILRPGPYACAEWDFGGLPAWLLAIPNLRLRCSFPPFVEAARRYLLRVGEELAPLQITRGGPILLVQVENEYGSYGDDHEYMTVVRDTLREAGFDVPLFTCDGPGAFERGSVDGAFPVANFNDDPAAAFKILKDFSPDTPTMCGEYYPGWFDHWGVEHHTRTMDSMLHDLETMLQSSSGFSIYMFHGGTSFGFTAGANADLDGRFMPQTTSYDYDAPLDEAGRPTAKFHALRELFGRFPEAEAGLLPAVPESNPVISIAPIAFTQSASLFENLPATIHDVQPRSMEHYGQNNGLILYRSRLFRGQEAPLTIRELHDYGLVFTGGEHIATLDRRLGQNRVQIAQREADLDIDILVEGMGRINYGPFILDPKGITGRVEFPVPFAAGLVMNWEVYPLPLDAAYMSALQFNDEPATGPAFHRAVFDLESVGDTFLDTRGWNKGFVWINGHNLGRHWEIGPQQTLYVPGCWLKQGDNEIILFDFESKSRGTVQGLAEPVLDEVGGK